MKGIINDENLKRILIKLKGELTMTIERIKNEFKHFKVKNKKKLIRTAERNEKTTIGLYKDLKRI